MTTSFLMHKNGHIAYDLSGEGPLVICAPSLGDVRAEYRFLRPTLMDAGYRVAVMDVRGHGETSPVWDDYSVAAIGEDMLALAHEINAGPAVLIGTSMAAGAAVWAAVEEPSAVNGLVLIDPFVDGDSNPFLVAVLSLMFTRPWGAGIWTKYYSSLYPTRKPPDFDAYLRDLRGNIAMPGRLEAVMAMLRASKRASGERLGRVSQPTLVLMSNKDPDFKAPEAELHRVAQAVRGKSALIPNAGHYPQAEMPEVTAPLILEFLSSLRSS